MMRLWFGGGWRCRNTAEWNSNRERLGTAMGVSKQGGELHWNLMMATGCVPLRYGLESDDIDWGGQHHQASTSGHIAPASHVDEMHLGDVRWHLDIHRQAQGDRRRAGRWWCRIHHSIFINAVLWCRLGGSRHRLPSTVPTTPVADVQTALQTSSNCGCGCGGGGGGWRCKDQRSSMSLSQAEASPSRQVHSSALHLKNRA